MRVPEPGFFLKRPTSDDQTAIMMVVRVNKKEILRFYTKESIKPKEWDPENKRAREGKNFPEGWEVNLRLQKFRLKFKSLFRELIDQKVLPSRAVIRSKMQEEFFDFLEKPSGLVRYFEDYIARIKDNKILSDEGRPFAIGTIETFNTALKHLKKYELARSKSLDMESIDMEFYYDYLDYFYSDNYSANSIYNPIKKLKQVLKYAEQEGYKVHPAFRNRRFSAPSELTDKIYLSEAEIKAIYEYKYELFSTIDTVRDRFILACCTGLRFGDYDQLRESNIFKNQHGEFVRTKSTKTSVLAVIPLNWMAKAILAKYNYNLPEMITNEKFNDYLKVIGEDAKLTQEIKISIRKDGKQTTETKKKWELIQSHTARRSFATNLFLAEYPSAEIMKITGHKTEHEFLKYIRASSEEVAFKMAQDPRFADRKS